MAADASAPVTVDTNIIPNKPAVAGIVVIGNKPSTAAKINEGTI
jgi:hypothetical protein